MLDGVNVLSLTSTALVWTGAVGFGLGLFGSVGDVGLLLLEVSPPPPPHAPRMRSAVGRRNEGRKRMRSSGRGGCFPQQSEAPSHGSPSRAFLATTSAILRIVARFAGRLA